MNQRINRRYAPNGLILFELQQGEGSYNEAVKCYIIMNEIP